MEFVFKTTATMKPHNNKKWWIDSGIVRDIRVEAGNLKEAIAKYRETVMEKHYISISDSAIRNKSPMYRDMRDGEAQQIGYVITGKADFEDGYKWTAQYIDLWVEIYTIGRPEF